MYSLAGIQKYFSKGQIVNTTFQISDRVILKRWINDTFFFLDIFLSLLIENAHAVNKELKKQVNTEISTYNALRDEKFAKADVEKFWNNKDYSQLVKFLNMHSQYLEGSILKNTNML